ncbi:uncharacterized protein [Notothenia coriiceps]|uniref:Uncharacterized protein LOC104958757 n=1 Tax=Notothenia coriiceps TaxID=8208 RepID=A0A6I9P9K0_9TELE|nr:PREDICTED: uncharacterized protein LOC104958757 [Notothenia coriiceps]XP_010784851.1 PREDICTED: uncharacterized protein LOC104958757 [Notothenia coriiceps]XP_010784852.1 PREDICTED: uncharacterized protein LOC104958757 [Notothenia coriiceps]
MQKVFSALISNMKELRVIFMLFWAAGLMQCFPATASQGGNSLEKLFFCMDPRCAKNVITIFCDDKLVSFDQIADCKSAGPPPPRTVCQHDGRAFVFTDTSGRCEFEAESRDLKTGNCKDHSDICTFFNGNSNGVATTTPSPVTTEASRHDPAKRGHIVVGVVVSVLLLLGVSCLIAYLVRRRNTERNQQTRDPREEFPLQTSDTRGDPLEDVSSLPQHHLGT